MKDADHPIMLTGEVARSLDLTDKGVHWLHASGKLPAILTKTGVRLFFRADVERLAAARRARKQEGEED